MGEFPSGQRGQTVNLLAMPSMVRIHLPPPKIPITLLGDWYFSLRGRWSRSLSPSGEIHLPPPKIPITRLGVGIFYAFSRRERSGRALPSPRGEGAERSEADEVERSRPPPVPPVVPPNPTTLHPSRRTAAPPSPQGEGLKSPSLAPPLLRRFGRSRLYAPSHPRCAQPRGQLPAGQTAHERVKTVGTYRQPAAHARPQIRLGPRRQRRKTHLASPHLRSTPFHLQSYYAFG